MDAEYQSWRRRVFRARGIPNRITTRDQTASLLGEELGIQRVAGIHVYSLATTLDVWETPPSRVATVQFDEIPQCVKKHLDRTEWSIPCGASDDVLILDIHFLWLTPLNDVEASEHRADCIAISGLASHPFGSWQPRGPDKTFMWIRDELPNQVPSVRAIIYGYDSTLVGSDSFQSISDVARTFANFLKVGGWNHVAAKPLIFLAHSLGGVVLKDAMIQVAGAQDPLYRDILYRVLGAVMLGVPSLGMEQAHLRAMVEKQANEVLVQDLCRGSRYLRRLDESFSGIAYTNKMNIFWVYETRESRVAVRKEDGTWDRNGPSEILVTPESATCRKIYESPHLTLPINENHSDMVKFTRSNHFSRPILDKLREMCFADSKTVTFNPRLGAGRATSLSPAEANEQASLEEHIMGGDNDAALLAGKKKAEEKERLNYEILLQSLDIQDLDSRVEGISERFQHTFEWIFELKIFTDWLQSGTGLFWINGKPGSGKSTLMKFIVQDKRTWDLIHDWNRGGREVHAEFFFHYRGSAIQKSFDGLIRSLFRQILKQYPALYRIVSPILGTNNQGHLVIADWTRDKLEQGLRLILEQNQHELDIHLFFDALDEFDGHPNSIIRFLRWLVENPGSSATRVKVCFSSRPRDVFQDIFENSPGFSLQDFTQTDIRDYCVGAIASSTNSDPSALELVPEILDRADGVFLWVSLVVKELSDSTASGNPKTVAQLRDILQALPTELYEFYQLIIERITRADRWKTYALLELVIRSSPFDSSLPLEGLVEAVEISDCRTYAMARARTNGMDNILMHTPGREAKQKIHAWSGGLLEIIKTPTITTVQFMHQTVHEFVTSLMFKQIVLGDLAKITHENGHSFHLKYLLLFQALSLSECRLAVSDHARKAEETTGKSHAEFIDGAPRNIFERLGSPSQRIFAISMSPLGFAAFAGLVLYFRDAAAQLPKRVESSGGNLLCHLWLGYWEIPEDGYLTLCRFLLKKGYGVNQDPGLLSVILETRLKDDFSSSNDGDSNLNNLEVLLLGEEPGERGENQGAHISALVSFSREINIQVSGPIESQPLYLGIPALVVQLLELGADINAANPNGMTPLDIALTSGIHLGRKDGARYKNILARYYLCCALIRRGAVSLKTSEEDWTMALYRFRMNGLNTGPLREHFENRQQAKNPEHDVSSTPDKPEPSQDPTQISHQSSQDDSTGSSKLQPPANEILQDQVERSPTRFRRRLRKIFT
ncbi:hypothetical protein AAE478_001543 [Parahypoxylon ruwenzoriense]